MKDKLILTVAVDYLSSITTKEIVEKPESNEEPVFELPGHFKNPVTIKGCLASTYSMLKNL